MQCGVELLASLTLALPRTVKVTLAFSLPTVKVTRALLSDVAVVRSDKLQVG